MRLDPDRNPEPARRTRRYVRQAALLLVFWLAVPGAADQPFAKGYRLDDQGYLGAAKAWPAWWAVLETHEKERQELRACIDQAENCQRYLKGVGTLLRRARDLTEEQQIRLVNRYVNRRFYRRDRSKAVAEAVASERLRNHWTTLAGFMKNGGDCEDYATTKYFLLRELGIPAERLRVLVVFERGSREYHAVVAARLPDDAVWLLEIDNSISRNRHAGYRFVYAVNEQSIWEYPDRT